MERAGTGVAQGNNSRRGDRKKGPRGGHTLKLLGSDWKRWECVRPCRPWSDEKGQEKSRAKNGGGEEKANKKIGAV